MIIIKLNDRQNIAGDSKLSKLYTQFAALLKELKTKQLTISVIDAINKAVEEINTSALDGNELKKLVKQKQTAILKQLEKELKIVPKKYYQGLWMAFGMSSIGLPIGVAFGLSVGNIGLLGIGLPIGLGIGALVGVRKDKKALAEGRQLDVEIKY